MREKKNVKLKNRKRTHKKPEIHRQREKTVSKRVEGPIYITSTEREREYLKNEKEQKQWGKDGKYKQKGFCDREHF